MTSIATLVCAGALNVALAVLLPPLMDGFTRKVRAWIQCRRGPPVLQTWYDVVKLARKKDVSPRGAAPIFTAAPYLSYSFTLVAALLIPMACRPVALQASCDLVLLVYLLASASILLALGGAASGNPFASIGASREFSMSMLLEAVVACCLIALAVKYDTLMVTGLVEGVEVHLYTASAVMAIAILLVASYIEGLRLPFDIPEAEPEIVEGLLVEYSGRKLALAQLTIMTKQFILLSLIASLIEPWSSKSLILGLPAFLGKITLLYLVFALVEPLYGRYRIDHALRYLGFLLSFAIITLILCVLGV